MWIKIEIIYFFKLRSDLDVVGILVKIANVKPKISLDCYLTIANILDDLQCETLKDPNQMVTTMLENLKKISDDFESNKFYRMETKIFANNKFRTIKAHTFNDRFQVKRSMYVILNGLIKLAVNAKFKYSIFYDKIFEESFYKTLYKSNQIEFEFEVLLPLLLICTSI